MFQPYQLHERKQGDLYRYKVTAHFHKIQLTDNSFAIFNNLYLKILFVDQNTLN